MGKGARPGPAEGTRWDAMRGPAAEELERAAHAGFAQGYAHRQAEVNWKWARDSQDRKSVG